MSSLVATVKQIEHCDSLHRVQFDCFGQTLSMISLDLDSTIKVDTKVKLIIKPSNIAIAKNFSGEISDSNQLDTTIVAIENGQLLSSVKVAFFDITLESIITLDASLKLDLKVADKVTALIKATAISIGEVISG